MKAPYPPDTHVLDVCDKLNIDRAREIIVRRWLRGVAYSRQSPMSGIVTPHRQSGCSSSVIPVDSIETSASSTSPVHDRGAVSAVCASERQLRQPCQARDICAQERLSTSRLIEVIPGYAWSRFSPSDEVQYLISTADAQTARE